MVSRSTYNHDPGVSAAAISRYTLDLWVFSQSICYIYIYIYIYMCWMLRVCNEKCQTYPGRLWLWGSTYLFFLDNKNHDWAAKLNAVSFSCKHGSVVWLFCTSLRFFLIKSRLWVVLHNTQTFCLTLLPLCQWICGLPFENRHSFCMHVVPLPGRSKFWMCINRCYPWQFHFPSVQLVETRVFLTTKMLGSNPVPFADIYLLLWNIFVHEGGDYLVLFWQKQQR